MGVDERAVGERVEVLAEVGRPIAPGVDGQAPSLRGGRWGRRLEPRPQRKYERPVLLLGRAIFFVNRYVRELQRERERAREKSMIESLLNKKYEGGKRARFPHSGKTIHRLRASSRSERVQSPVGTEGSFATAHLVDAPVCS